MTNQEMCKSIVENVQMIESREYSNSIIPVLECIIRCIAYDEAIPNEEVESLTSYIKKYNNYASVHSVIRNAMAQKGN